MVRTKLVAVLLGPSGVGLVSLYRSITELVGVLSGLGIQNSGVREIAKSYSLDDEESQALAVKTLRRACWITGLLGWLITAALAWPLSQWLFESHDHAWVLVIIGFSLVLTSVGNGQRALLQGRRRIADIAKINVYGVLAGTAVALAVYGYYGKEGIPAVIILTALCNLLISWKYSRTLQSKDIPLQWLDTWKHAKGLVGVGLAFMTMGLFSASIAMVTRLLIIKNIGIEANGMYQAAWALSGLFAGFILRALSMDFYPRLSAISENNDKVNVAVNEQTEIGVLLSLPGLIGTLTFAPLLISLFYTSEFMAAAEVLPWLILGVFAKIIVWPMGMIQVAKGASRWIYFSEITGFLAAVAMIYWLIGLHGLIGVGMAIMISQLISIMLSRFVAGRLSQFFWSRKVLALMALTISFLVPAFFAQRWMPPTYALLLGGALTALAGVVSARGIGSRLGKDNRLVKVICSVPGGNWLCGV